MNAKKILKTAAYSLICDHDIDDITVNMILEAAEISKKTFYRYYPDKYALANEIYDDLFSVPTYDTERDPDEAWEELYIQQFALFRAEQDFVRHLYSSKAQGCTTDHEIEVILKYDRERLRQMGADPDDPRIMFALEAKDVSGTYAMRKWILGGMKESDKEMAIRFKLILPAILISYFT